MVEGAGVFDAGLPGHGLRIATRAVNVKILILKSNPYRPSPRCSGERNAEDHLFDAGEQQAVCEGIDRPSPRGHGSFSWRKPLSLNERPVSDVTVCRVIEHG